METGNLKPVLRKADSPLCTLPSRLFLKGLWRAWCAVEVENGVAASNGARKIGGSCCVILRHEPWLAIQIDIVAGQGSPTHCHSFSNMVSKYEIATGVLHVGEISA